MTETEKLKTYIKEWVNAPHSPKFAIMLEGPWGSGKTFLVNELIKDNDLTPRKRIYISLFGINSVRDFESQLSLAAMTKTEKLVRQGLGFASSLISGSLSLQNDGLNGSVDLNKAMDKILEVTNKTTSAIEASFIVIDDLERTELNLSEFLGVINRYVEHGDARILIVANSDQVGNSRFRDFKEKVIGQTFLVTAQPRLALKAFIEEVQEPKSRKVLTQNEDMLHDLYVMSGYNNLRAMRHFVWTISRILQEVDDKFLKHDQLMASFITQGFIFFTEFKLDLGGISRELDVSDIAGKNSSDHPDDRTFYEWKFNDKEPDTPRRKVLKKYGALSGIHTAITLQHWAEVLETGIVSEVRLNEELRGAPELASEDDWPEWRRLWYFHSTDFRKPENVTRFEADLQSMLRRLEKGDFPNEFVFMHVVGIIIRFSKDGLLKGKPETWVKKLCAAVDEFIIPKMKLDDRSLRRLDLDSGYDGLGYVSREDEDFETVLNHLRHGVAQAFKNWKVKDASLTLLETLKNDYFEFLGDFTVINGKGRQSFLDEAMLQRIPPAKFVEAWLSLQREYERGLLYDIRDRYQRRPKLIEDEGPWWEKVREVVLKEARKRDVAQPRKVQLTQIAEGIDRLLSTARQDLADQENAGSASA